MVIQIDASVPIRSGMPVWPGDAPVNLELTSSIADGDACNVTLARFSVHTGTHVDAPAHFIAGGGGVEGLPLGALIGPAYVLDLGDHQGALEAHHLSQTPPCERLVLRTGNTRRGLMGKDTFSEDYAHLAESAAMWLVESGVRLIGVDYLSVEGFNTGSHVVHDTLLGAGVVALEGLDLTDVEGGWWNLICLPSKLQGADGSPARVVFQREDASP